MPLVKEKEVLPKKDSIIYIELRVYDTDHQAYKPYISPYNSDAAERIQQLEEEKKKKKKEAKKKTKKRYKKKSKKVKTKKDKKKKKKRTDIEEVIFRERHAKIKGYFLQFGKVKAVNVYKDIIKCNWNEDYTGLRGDLSIELPVTHERLNHIYKGVHVSLHLIRLQYDTSIKNIKKRDHKAYLESQRTYKRLKKRQKKPKKYLIKDPLHIPYFTELEKVFDGFVEDIEIKPEHMNVKVSSYSKALEQEDLMTFRDMYRSDILKEVIKSAGMVPLIDTKGMIDEKINWSSNKQNEQSSGQAAFGDDCTDSHKMAVQHGLSHGNAGTGKDYDHDAKKGYAKKDSNYYKWATQFKNGEAMLISLRKMFKYKYYRNNRTCPQKLFNQGGFASNCADASRLVKVCCDSIGFPCVIVHGNIYRGGHYWNVIKTKKSWKTFDLCYSTKSRGDSGGTNTSGLF